MLTIKLPPGDRVVRAAPRRGISLIETAAAMSAGMILMGVTLTTLIAVQQADSRRTREQSARLGTIQLLDRLRDDLHSCQDFTWSDSEQALRLTTAGGSRIVFERAPQRWVRTNVAGSKTVYRRPAGQQIRVEPAEGASGDLARLRLYSKQRSGADENDELVAVELNVEIGRDTRLLNQ